MTLFIERERTYTKYFYGGLCVIVYDTGDILTRYSILWDWSDKDIDLNNRYAWEYDYEGR